MDLILLAVGRLRPAYRALCDDYLRRLGRHVAAREVEVKEASRAPTVDAQREEEGSRLMARMPERARLVALTREGDGWSISRLSP